MKDAVCIPKFLLHINIFKKNGLVLKKRVTFAARRATSSYKTSSGQKCSKDMRLSGVSGVFFCPAANIG